MMLDPGSCLLLILADGLTSTCQELQHAASDGTSVLRSHFHRLLADFGGSLLVTTCAQPLELPVPVLTACK